MRDIEKYVDPEIVPSRPEDIFKDRKLAIETGSSRENTRVLGSGKQKLDWLKNMAAYHQFSVSEICMATGLSAEEVMAELNELDIADPQFPLR